MKQIPLKLSVALGTFFFSLALVVAWFYFIQLNKSEWLPPSLVFNEDVSEPREGLYVCKDFTNKFENTTMYFPKNILDDNEKLDSFRINWRAKHLKAMNEPSFLSVPDEVNEAYRFLWLRSFHHPIAVRVWRVGEQRCLTVKELDGAGGYEPGKIIVNETRPLTENQWIAFKVKLEQGNFWNLPSHNKHIGLDGAEWIVEGSKEKDYKVRTYHVVDRYDGGDNRLACLYLLRLSELKIKEDDIY